MVSGALFISIWYSREPIFAVPEGSGQGLRIDRIHDVIWRQALGLQARHVQIDLNLTDLAAIRVGRGRTGDGRQLRANEVLPQVEEHLLRHGFAADAELHNRGRGRRIGNDEGWRSARRQAAHGGLDDGGHLGQRRLNVGLRLEEDLDNADALHRLRLDVLDVVHRHGHAALGIGDDATCHVGRREAVEVPNHANDRDVDVGEDIDRGAQDNQGHQENDDQRHYNKGIRTPKRKGNNPHLLGFDSLSV